MMRILVLGGDGFIGSHFVDQAVTLEHEVTVFDRFPYQISKNLEHQRANINFISGEIANRNDVYKALEGIDVVYHFVSMTAPVDSWNDPFIEIDNNLRFSIQLFKLASRQGIRKIVFPSSGGTVYGPQNKPITENTLPRPSSPYGITKLAIEHFLHYYREHSGIEIDIYRIGNAYGPRQPTQSKQGVIAVWMQNILDGAEIQVFGDHTTLRDYVYVKDISFLMTNSLRNLASSNVNNLGTGVGTSIIRLLEIFRTVIDNPIRYRIHPRRPSDNASIILDSSRLLGQFPDFKFQKLEDKISETWNYFKSRHKRK
jgi:UDP-glucose 4-epimerase